MRPMTLPLTYGIEEEFFLVDPQTRGLATRVPTSFMRQCRARFGDRVHEELLRAQVETTTSPLHSTEDAREALTELRAGVSRIAASTGMHLVGAGTHPTANWESQATTDKARYDELVDDFQIIGRRSMVCGMHVHVGIPDGVDRVALMNRLMSWLPMFLALSTSSPFWNGRSTGLLSYRQAAYDEWPRSGIPDNFRDEVEYRAFVDLLVRSGAVKDGSYLWWAIRPSVRYPTLELRISDACTRVEDALALAAAFRCLVRAHLRQPHLGPVPSRLSRRVVDENRWRAKRYGTEASFIDEVRGALVPMPAVLAEFSAMVAPDAEAFQCEAELRHLAVICEKGTSAHAQLEIYRQQRDLFQSRESALSHVVDWLSRTTAAEPSLDGRSTGSLRRHGDVIAMNA